MTNFENLIENMTPETLVQLADSTDTLCESLGYEIEDCPSGCTCRECALDYLQQEREE